MVFSSSHPSTFRICIYTYYVGWHTRNSRKMENVGKSLTPFHFRKTKTNPEGGGILIANQ